MLRRIASLGIVAVALAGLTGCAGGPHRERATDGSAVATHETAGALVVAGALPRTGALTRAELEALGAVDGRWMHHDRERTFRGVPLDAVLAHLGLERGSTAPEIAPADRAPGWKRVVVATAADGFEAVFTCAELMPAMGPTRAFVVWEVDGAPLAEGKGPFQILVPTDREGSRCPFALRRIDVIDVGKLRRGGS